MLNLKLIPTAVLKVFRNECDYTDEEMARWTAEEMLDAWLEWEGIIGYTDYIVRNLDAFRKAEQ